MAGPQAPATSARLLSASRALSVATLLLACGCTARADNTAATLAQPSSTQNPVGADAQANLARRLAALQFHALRLANLRFGPAAPDARRLVLSPDRLSGRIAINNGGTPSVLTVSALPLDRESPAFQQRKIKELMPSAPPSTRGLRSDRLPSIQAEAYGLQTSRSYHVLVLFADHLVEIGGPAAEEDERQLIRDFVQPLVVSLIEAADLTHARSLEESSRETLARQNEFERLEIGEHTEKLESGLIFTGRRELTDNRLLALAEHWFTAEDEARFSRDLGVAVGRSSLRARSTPGGTESLNRRISAIRSARQITLRIIVTRPNKSGRIALENPDPRKARGWQNISSFPVAISPESRSKRPGARGYQSRWKTFAHQISFVDGYLVEIAVSAATADDPVLASEFIDSQMAELLDRLGVDQSRLSD